jgi:hypothetical protein
VESKDLIHPRFVESLFLSTAQLIGSGWGFRKTKMALENKKGKYLMLLIGFATEFRSEKILWNRLGMASVILRKKVLIPRHSEVYGSVNSEARNERKWHDKN